MSVAWTAPVALWREPARASVLRVGVRLVVALAWLVLALISPWAWLSLLLWVCSGLAVVHAALGVANRIKNGGVTLRLMGSGALEWPQSLQEQWLRRPVDFVDGARIEVIVEAPIPVQAPAAPHVILKGETRQLAHLPLHGRTPGEFMETVNALVEGRGIVLVEEGAGRKPREP